MKLDNEVIEKIKAKAAPIAHGSVEVLLDETKNFVDVISTNRERIVLAESTSRTVNGMSGKHYVRIKN